MLKEILITEQPVCACVPPDFPLTLRCRAQGPMILHYQWFMQWESVRTEIPGATRPDLHVEARQTQLYVCRVNDQNQRFLFSRWVKVKVLQDIPDGYISHNWNGEPIIIIEPVSAHVKAHNSVWLHCHALGIPAPEYQWYHNGLFLPHGKGKQIKIKSMKHEDSGSYLCCVSNTHGEIWSKPAELHLEENIILQESPQPLVSQAPKQPDKCFAAGKVALLIGNNGYLNHANLLAPMVDVFELSVLLKKLGFCVISLVDLACENLWEMMISAYIAQLDGPLTLPWCMDMRGIRIGSYISIINLEIQGKQIWSKYNNATYGTSCSCVLFFTFSWCIFERLIQSPNFITLYAAWTITGL